MKLSFFAFVVYIISSTLPGYTDVVINEIMYHPASLSIDDEYIELYNDGDNEVDLAGWSFVDGVDYFFPPGTGIEAGQSLIFASSPENFIHLNPKITVVGPYHGRLNNDGETIVLVGVYGNEIDLVSYRDEAGWPPEADGFGPSLERIHPRMPGSNPESWRTSPIGGTPGLKNASAIDLPVPIVTDVNQNPVSPASLESVSVSCHVYHSQPIRRVSFFCKLESDGLFQEIELIDDGLHGDHRKNDGVYGGEIPPHPNQSIVEFYIQAEDDLNQSGTFPLAGPDRAAIYRIDDGVYESDLPLYRIIMRASDENTLRSRSVQSNDELDASFVVEDQIYYNVGVRFRGKGSRHVEPKSYRVNFSNGPYYGSIRKLNLNAVEPYRQYVGLEIFKVLRMPCPEKQFVSVLFNKAFVHNYIQVERTDKQMMERLFGDGDGNVYRGVEQANLDYRGENPQSYRANYEKVTNELQDDYSDIIRLCEAFSNPDDSTFKSGLDRRIKTTQWIRWFAIKKILNDLEGGLSKERGDDYYMYHYPVDDLFYLLPWDLDSIFVRPFREIHQYDTPAVKRLITHPDLARLYYAELVNILENELPQYAVDAIIDQTAAVADEAVRNEMKQISREMREFILSAIPRELTVNAMQEVNLPVIQDGETWRYFQGSSEPPAGWNQPDFDDSSWESGPGGFGYGDNDDRTAIDDMSNNYSTVFIRKTFAVDDPASYRQLLLNVLYDDAFVAYLNGVEVARSNFSGVPDSRSFADGNHEASAVEQFAIDNPAAILVPGKNTLALVGLNVTLSSSDFSLAVSLDGIRLSALILDLSGRADAARTQWIRVNGLFANYVTWKAEWSYPVVLETGRNLFHIEALNDDADVIDTIDVALYKDIPAPTDGRETYGDEYWNESQIPVTITQNIIVPESDSLKIGPGVTVKMASGTAIIVYGTLIVDGSGERPIRFGPADGQSNWGGVAIEKAVGEIRITNAHFSGTKAFGFREVDYPAAVSIHSSTAIIEHCTFTEAGGLGIDATSSTVTVRGNSFKSMGEMVHCLNGFSIIENNVFDNVLGYSDAIDLDGQMGAPSVIRNNTIRGSEDDGIDLGGTSALIENNWIERCADKGISLEMPSDVTLVNNIVLRAGTGIAVKDRCNAQAIHNTIVSCTTGLSVFEKILGQGGASADVRNCVIWNTIMSLNVDDKSTVSLQFSDLMQLPDEFIPTNRSLDPMFTDITNDRLTLLSNSPLIDSGVETDVATDFAGNKRPSGSAADIGAFEYQQAVRVSDWNLF